MEYLLVLLPLRLAPQPDSVVLDAFSPSTILMVLEDPETGHSPAMSSSKSLTEGLTCLLITPLTQDEREEQTRTRSSLVIFMR